MRTYVYVMLAVLMCGMILPAVNGRPHHSHDKHSHHLSKIRNSRSGAVNLPADGRPARFTVGSYAWDSRFKPNRGRSRGGSHSSSNTSGSYSSKYDTNSRSSSSSGRGGGNGGNGGGGGSSSHGNGGSRSSSYTRSRSGYGSRW